MSPKKFLGLSFLFFLVAVVPVMAHVQTGFLDREVIVSGTSYHYQVYVPANFKTKKSWPVILFLHGSGERGSDGLHQTDVGLPHAIRADAARFPFIVVMPQCANDKIWSSPDMEAQVMAALDASIREFHGDRERVYLTGLSMGGFGTWEFAVGHPRRFAALVAVCSGLLPIQEMPELHLRMTDDPKIRDPFAEVAKRVGRIPIWIFHGDADGSVPVSQARHLAEALTAAHANFKYTEYPGVGHNSWDKAYSEPELVPWLLMQSLKAAE